MSQIPVALEKLKKIDDGLDTVIISHATSLVEKEYFEFDPAESKDEILNQLDEMGIYVNPPNSLEVQEWKRSDVLPQNVHFDTDKIKKIVIKQVTEGLFSLRIFTVDGSFEEQKFGHGRVLDLKRFHDLLIVDA